MSVSKKTIKKYWNDRAEWFFYQRIAELDDNKSKLWKKEINRYLPKKKKLKILDIGCGAGYFEVLLAKTNDIIGIDISKKMIKSAQKLAEQFKVKCEFQVMNAEKLDFNDEEFDVVIARNVMWNLNKPQDAYKEWIRVLKKDGVLLNFDAQYATLDHEPEITHPNTSEESAKSCKFMYDNLEISSYDRPYWDGIFLMDLDVRDIRIDLSVGSRLYSKKDRFYSPAPMFSVIATKGALLDDKQKNLKPSPVYI